MPKHNYSFEAIGTQWQIETDTSLTSAVKQDIATCIKSFDAVYSRFRADSLVCTIAEKGKGSYQFPDSIKDLLHWYQKLYIATNQKVTPLIGRVLEDLGYDQTYSLQKKAATSAPLWDDVLSLDGSTVNVLQPVTIDIGAAGKGYLVDCIAEILIHQKIESFVIDASGDMYVSQSEQTIGLENPLDPSKVLGVTRITNGALCASASNRRKWGGDLHHIVDPHTAQPVQDVIATWVIAATTMQADGIATALFFVPPEQLRDIAGFSYVILFSNGSMKYSKDNTWELFT